MIKEETAIYNVVLSGNTLKGFKQDAVIKAISNVLNISTEAVLPLFRGKPTIILRELSHTQARLKILELKQLGAMATLSRTAPDKSNQFSMVPDGEEQTSFDILAERHKKGEKIACKNCATQQIISAKCIKCGKQLFGSSIKEDASNVKNTKKALFFLKIAAILLFSGLSIYLIWLS